MRRVYLENLISVKGPSGLFIKGTLFYRKTKGPLPFARTLPLPIKNLDLLSKGHFFLTIELFDHQNLLIRKISTPTNNFGNFHLFLDDVNYKNLKYITIYERSKRPGIEINLGTYIPQEFTNSKGIIISDFDKTLVDTQYSTIKQIWRSLTQNLNSYPNVNQGIERLKKHINSDLSPIILSASPHFYYQGIRNWLYNHSIYTAPIFLKDYRSIFGSSSIELYPKDFSKQGIYKLMQLMDIVIITSFPEKIVLIGDNHEDDLLIYLHLKEIICSGKKPTEFIDKLRGSIEFKAKEEQLSLIYQKAYFIYSRLKNKRPVDVKIEIREITKKAPLQLKGKLHQYLKEVSFF